jgi:hypothetical protein
MKVRHNFISEKLFPDTGKTRKQIQVLRKSAPALVTGNQIVGYPVDVLVDLTGKGIGRNPAGAIGP